MSTMTADRALDCCGTQSATLGLISALPIVCPVCPKHLGGGVDFSKMSLEKAYSGIVRGSNSEVLDGTLICDGAECRRRYPIIDGVPIISRDTGKMLAGQLGILTDRALPAKVVELLIASGVNDPGWTDYLAQTSHELYGQWPDMSVPREQSAIEPLGSLALLERLQSVATTPVHSAIDMWCGSGRVLFELAKGAKFAVGIDSRIAVCRRALQLLRGDEISFPRQIGPGRYESATIKATATSAVVLCGELLFPPCLPRWFDRVAAINVIERVPEPWELLSVMDALCVAGGEIVLTAYRGNIPIAEGTGRSTRRGYAEEIRKRLTTGAGIEAVYAIEDEAELPAWRTQDWRRGGLYHCDSVFYMRARKSAATT